jgi:hypothetical protein
MRPIVQSVFTEIPNYWNTTVLQYVRFEVPTVLTVKVTEIWDKALCSLIKFTPILEKLGATVCRVEESSVLKMGKLYQTTLRHMHECCKLFIQCDYNQNCNMVQKLYRMKQRIDMVFMLCTCFVFLFREQEDFVGLSFETISAVGPHAAVVHYRPAAETDRQITTEEVYLCDSGGQYR